MTAARPTLADVEVALAIAIIGAPRDVTEAQANRLAKAEASVQTQGNETVRFEALVSGCLQERVVF